MGLIHVLDKQSDVIIGTLNNKKAEYYQARETVGIENKDTFDFTALAKFDILQSSNRLLVQDSDGDFNEYIITFTDQYKRNEKHVQADASFIDLTKAKVIEPTELTGATPQTAVDFALQGTGWQPGDVEWASILRTIKIDEHIKPYELLKKIASTFDMELRFRVVVDGNRIIGRYVDMVKEIAAFEGKEITFGKDLVGIRRIENSRDIVTALVGVGPIRDDGTQLSVFVEDEDALQRWGRNGNHLMDVYMPVTDDADMTIERLTSLTRTELDKRIKSSVSYECKAVSLEKVFGREHEKIRKGQTVRIKDDGYTPPLYLEARIQELSRNPATDEVVDFKIGNFIEYDKADLEKEIAALRKMMADKINIDKVVDYVDSNAEKIIPVQPNPPVNPSTNDKWIDTSGPINVLKSYENNRWIKASPTEASEIGGIEEGKQYANGLLWDAIIGLIVQRDDGLTRAVMSGSDGFYIEQKQGNQWVKVFWVDSNGDAIFNGVFAGRMNWDVGKGGTLTLGGQDDTYGRLVVLDKDGETIADLDASEGGFDRLHVGDLSSPTVPNYNNRSYTIYVDPINGDDNKDGSNWANAKKTIQNSLDSIPKINDGDIEIQCHYENSRNIIENIVIDSFLGSGSIFINGQTWNNYLTGHIVVNGCTNYIYIQDLTINAVDNKGIDVNNCTYVYAEKIWVYGGNGSSAFSANYGSNLHLVNCQGYEAGIIIYARRLSRILVGDCKGLGNNRGMAGQTGGEIRVRGTYPNGSVSATYFDGGGNMIGTGTADSGAKGTVPTKKVTKQWSTKSGSNYGGNYAGGWEPGVVRQGNWGYGQRKGLYYFGTSLTALHGKNIDAMRVWVKRQSNGGYSKKTPIYIRTHNYTAQPTGDPTLSSSSVRVDLAWGDEGAWVTLPSAMVNAFKNGTARGIGVWANSTNNVYYANMTTECWVEATYAE